MTETNTSPVDINQTEIAQYKSGVEDLLQDYYFRGAKHKLTDKLINLDPNEDHVMSNIERDTYLTIRDGMQVYDAIANMLEEQTGTKKHRMSLGSAELRTDQKLKDNTSFCNNFAVYAASQFVVKKLESIISSEGGSDSEPRNHDYINLDLETGKESVKRNLLVPLYADLVNHEENGQVFNSPLEFPVFAKEVFSKYIELTGAKKDEHPELAKHVDGYTWRIMDEFVMLHGFEDRSIAIEPKKQDVTFVPISSNEIVGNQAAKRKITRYMDRMALYDVENQINPILELGGLSWTNLFDGPPGTGKTSMFRMAMTLLQERAENLGIEYTIFSVDQSIKDEFYGKTGKILLERLAAAKNPRILGLGIFDDIDLLTSSRQDAQGADNDVNNIIMQYLDGAFTVRGGNVINFAASNEPTGLDNAMRNRFSDRLLIDGPKSREDFADMMVLMGGKLMKNGLLVIDKNYTPFATQDQRTEEGWTGDEDVSAYMAEKFADRKDASLIDFGEFMHDLKKENNLITGRSTKAIIEAVKERTANFDVPIEWLSTRGAFHEKPMQERLGMLKELYTPITPDILFQEAQRYFDSEERFTATEADGHVQRGYNNRKWDLEADLKFWKDELAAGVEGSQAKIIAIQRNIHKIAQDSEKVIMEALANAEKADEERVA